MSDILATAGSAVAITKQLLTLSKTIQNAELQHAIAELTLQLAELKLQLAELITENADLKQRVKEKASTQLQFRDGYYFKENDTHPFCPGCYDENQKSIRLAKQEGMNRNFGGFQCPSCKQFFG